MGTRSVTVGTANVDLREWEEARRHWGHTRVGQVVLLPMM
jgi:hypothetical protein